ncbi:MAG TPA: hypothetical protein VGA31_08820 [Thermoanaerobaculia bacterium]
MKRGQLPGGLLFVALCALSAVGCSRRARGPRPLEPLRGDAAWFSDGNAPDEPGIEEALAKFHCAAVFLPARQIVANAEGWTGSDLPTPARPISRIPVVLVVRAAADPLEGATKDRAEKFGAFLAKEIEAAVSRGAAFGPLRGIHMDVPFSGATAEAHAAAFKEARSLLTHGLSRAGTRGRLPRGVALTWSLRRPPPNEKKSREAVRALASRIDGFVAFVFGGGNGADPASTDALGKLWWAGYEPAGGGVVRRKSGESGPRVPEAALDALTNDSRLELVQEVPWKEEKGWEFSLRATRDVAAGGLALSAGDSVTFTFPSLADMRARFESDRKERRFARGRLVVFEGRSEAGRLFPISALPDALAGRWGAPDLQVWESPEGGRLLRVGAENGSVNASLVSRVENWIEVDVAPARVSDVEPGAFDRWEVYDAAGRRVSPGRASRVRLFETFVAPLEQFSPARLQVRGALPSPCCRTRTHVAPAAGGEPVATDWALPALVRPRTPGPGTR